MNDLMNGTLVGRDHRTLCKPMNRSSHMMFHEL
jgi:hypothetical protein